MSIVNYQLPKAPFIGKEKDKESYLGDFGVRKYDDGIGRFTSTEPLWEEFYSVSPYVYSLNNPIGLLDLTGFAPGDFFSTMDMAANDFGLLFNDNSIRESQEYGSTIYEITITTPGVTVYGYTYTVPAVGTSGSSVQPSPAPSGSKSTADIHTHGSYSFGQYYDNQFSSGDIKDNNKNKLIGFVATTNGSLQKYDPRTGIISLVNNNMPSDSNDPSRRNTVTSNPTTSTYVIQNSGTIGETIIDIASKFKVTPLSLIFENPSADWSVGSTINITQ